MSAYNLIDIWRKAIYLDAEKTLSKTTLGLLAS